MRLKEGTKEEDLRLWKSPNAEATPEQLGHRAAGARRRQQSPRSHNDYRRAGTAMSAENNSISEEF